MTGKTVVQGVTVTALMLAAVASPAAAQAKLELTPYFTSYYALSPVVDFSDAGSGFTLEAKQIAAPGLGGRLTYWMPSGLGFEAAGAYVFSNLRILVNDPTVPTQDQSLKGNMTAVTGRVLYRLPRSNFHLFGGAGVVMRGGEVWEGIDDLSDVAGVAGFGARASVTPKLSLDIKVEAYLYSFNGLEGTGVNAEFQSDFHVSIGIPLALMK